MKFLVLSLLVTLFALPALSAQATVADSSKLVREWLSATDINLDGCVERLCESITGKSLSVDTLMRPNTSYIRAAIKPERDSFLAKYSSEFPQDMVLEGIQTLVTLRVAAECPDFMRQMQEQLVIAVHRMFKLTDEQAAFVDRIALTSCGCGAKEKDCVLDRITAEDKKEVERLFPEKGEKSSFDQLYSVISMWHAVGCP
ncbi:hypothetical protein [Neolewinella agarilytica]|uniref:hypothetical protein n=1 Tax=Neolewinella agarilytica TaxID=478744 RepID=UPI002354743F|nr:hypothetical protein [Neolewinella agarilytica]